MAVVDTLKKMAVSHDTTTAEDLLALAEQREASMRKAFKRYDTNNNGSIESDELALLLVDLGFDDATCEAEFEKADKDGSLSITFDEFCMYYNTLLDKIAAATRGVRMLGRRKSRDKRVGRRRKSSGGSSQGHRSTPRSSPRPSPRVPLTERPPKPGPAVRHSAPVRRHAPRLGRPRHGQGQGRAVLPSGGGGGVARSTAAAAAPQSTAAPSLRIEEGGAVSRRVRGAGGTGNHDSSPTPPPRPELIRFDSISDEIAAYERGEIVAPAAAPTVDTRVACKTCGRKFVPKSIARHERICAKATANAKRRGKFKVTRVRR